MTDPRIEVAARAICDRHNGVWLDGDYDHDNDVWRCDAAAALAAADAVVPRERVSTETVRWFVAKWGHDYELVEACDAERKLIDRLAARLTSELRERGVEVVE